MNRIYLFILFLFGVFSFSNTQCVWSQNTSPTPLPTTTPAPNYTTINPIVITQGNGGEPLVHIRDVNPQQSHSILSQFRPVSKRFFDEVGGGTGRCMYFSKGDLNHDGIPDMVFSFGAVVSDATFPNMVVPYDTVTKKPVGHPFMAFPNGDGHPVRYNGGEIRTAVGDFLEDGTNLIAAAQGTGSQLGLVRLFEYTGLEAPNAWRVVAQFQPLDNRLAQNNANGGVTLTAGDVDNDGKDELLVGQTNSNTSLTQFTVIDIDSAGQNHRRFNYTAFWEGFRGQGGVELAVLDLNGDGKNEIVASSKGKSADEQVNGNLLSVILPIVENQTLTGFARPVGSSIELNSINSVNPSGMLNIGVGEFDGNVSNGQELVIGSGDGAPQSFYFIVKVNYDDHPIFENGEVTGLSYLTGQRANLGFVQPAFLNNDNPPSGEVFVGGVEFLR